MRARLKTLRSDEIHDLPRFVPSHPDEFAVPVVLEVGPLGLKGRERFEGAPRPLARALGFGIGTAITLLNPARIVIGGGVSKSGERWWRTVRESARANTLPQMRVEIVPTTFGDDAPLWGAIALSEQIER